MLCLCFLLFCLLFFFFFFQAEDGIRDGRVTGVQTCALPISSVSPRCRGCSVFAERSRYTVMRSRGREVLHEMMIWSERRPDSRANSVDSSAEITRHSLMICSESLPRL